MVSFLHVNVIFFLFFLTFFYLMGIVGPAFAPEKRYHKDEARNEKKNAAKHSPKTANAGYAKTNRRNEKQNPTK